MLFPENNTRQRIPYQCIQGLSVAGILLTAIHRKFFGLTYYVDNYVVFYVVIYVVIVK